MNYINLNDDSIDFTGSFFSIMSRISVPKVAKKKRLELLSDIIPPSSEFSDCLEDASEPHILLSLVCSALSFKMLLCT